MKIALDYDKTYTLDKDFWDEVIYRAEKRGHEIRIVTTRSPKNDYISDDRLPCQAFPVIYCDGVAKRFHCHWFADDGNGWDPDVWIDDKPQGVDNNSTATKEILEAWRASEEHDA